MLQIQGQNQEHDAQNTFLIHKLKMVASMAAADPSKLWKEVYATTKLLVTSSDKTKYIEYCICAYSNLLVALPSRKETANFLTCIGDLNRYIGGWDIAIANYQKAAAIHPQNGKLYSLIAISYQLDPKLTYNGLIFAVSYACRALMVSAPFPALKQLKELLATRLKPPLHQENIKSIDQITFMLLSSCFEIRYVSETQCCYTMIPSKAFKNVTNDWLQAVFVTLTSFASLQHTNPALKELNLIYLYESIFHHCCIARKFSFIHLTLAYISTTPTSFSSQLLKGCWRFLYECGGFYFDSILRRIMPPTHSIRDDFQAEMALLKGFSPIFKYLLLPTETFKCSEKVCELMVVIHGLPWVDTKIILIDFKSDNQHSAFNLDRTLQISSGVSSALDSRAGAAPVKPCGVRSPRILSKRESTQKTFGKINSNNDPSRISIINPIDMVAKRAKDTIIGLDQPADTMGTMANTDSTELSKVKMIEFSEFELSEQLKTEVSPGTASNKRVVANLVQRKTNLLKNLENIRQKSASHLVLPDTNIYIHRLHDISKLLMKKIYTLIVPLAGTLCVTKLFLN